ncbi:MAG TPA: hypothetical protein VGB55_12910 [Tepidisphaeraceae bacterium]
MSKMKRPKARNREDSRTKQNGAGANAGKTRPRATAKKAREARAVRRGEPVSPGVGGGA